MLRILILAMAICSFLSAPNAIAQEDSCVGCERSPTSENCTGIDLTILPPDQIDNLLNYLTELQVRGSPDTMNDFDCLVQIVSPTLLHSQDTTTTPTQNNESVVQIVHALIASIFTEALVRSEAVAQILNDPRFALIIFRQTRDCSLLDDLNYIDRHFELIKAITDTRNDIRSNEAFNTPNINGSPDRPNLGVILKTSFDTFGLQYSRSSSNDKALEASLYSLYRFPDVEDMELQTRSVFNAAMNARNSGRRMLALRILSEYLVRSIELDRGQRHSFSERYRLRTLFANLLIEVGLYEQAGFVALHNRFEADVNLGSAASAGSTEQVLYISQALLFDGDPLSALEMHLEQLRLPGSAVGLPSETAQEFLMVGFAASAELERLCQEDEAYCMVSGSGVAELANEAGYYLGQILEDANAGRTQLSPSLLAYLPAFFASRSARFDDSAGVEFWASSGQAYLEARRICSTPAYSTLAVRSLIAAAQDYRGEHESIPRNIRNLALVIAENEFACAKFQNDSRQVGWRELFETLYQSPEEGLLAANSETNVALAYLDAVASSALGEGHSLEIGEAEFVAFQRASMSINTVASSWIESARRLPPTDGEKVELVSRRAELLETLQTRRFDDLVRMAGGDATHGFVYFHGEEVLLDIFQMEQGLAELDADLSAANSDIDIDRHFYAQINDIHSTIRDGSAALMLLPSEQGLHGILFTREDSPRWYFTPIPSQMLRGLVARFRQSLNPSDEFIDNDGAQSNLLFRETFTFDSAAAFQLYQLLFAPIEEELEGLSSIDIFSAGYLSGIPLEALVTEAPDSDITEIEGLGGLHWLIDKQFTVRYILSPLPLSNYEEESKTTVSRTVIFGAPETRIPEGFSPDATLISAIDYLGISEVEDLSLVEDFLEFGPDFSIDSDVSFELGPQFTEPTVRDVISSSNFETIVFATHGLVANELNDFGIPSLLLSSPSAITDDPSNDGLLTTREIAALRINARLVVLTACNTASADGVSNASMSGLARAFFQAGAQDLIVSHWRVSQEHALSISRQVIVEINRGTSPELALKKAAIGVRDGQIAETGSQAHPSLWAPFVAVGSMSRTD